MESKCAGSSRAFITYVLHHALLYTREIVVSPETPLCLPFPPKIVSEWLKKASVDCLSNPTYQESLGGTPYDTKVYKSYWKSPKQLYTWWKNNVERKAKYHKLRAMSKVSIEDNLDGKR